MSRFSDLIDAARSGIAAQIEAMRDEPHFYSEEDFEAMESKRLQIEAQASELEALAAVERGAPADAVDHDDFAGIVVHRYHCTGDERQPVGAPVLMTISDATPGHMLRLLKMGDGSEPTMRAWPVFRKPGF